MLYAQQKDANFNGRCACCNSPARWIVGRAVREQHRARTIAQQFTKPKE